MTCRRDEGARCAERVGGDLDGGDGFPARRRDVALNGDGDAKPTQLDRV
jgi:hypothetical protein